MHDRKQRMADEADAFLCCQVPSGTMDEFFEIWTWRQLGIHRKPIGLLNAGGYDHLLHLMNHIQSEGFMGEETTRLVAVDHDARLGCWPRCWTRSPKALANRPAGSNWWRPEAGIKKAWPPARTHGRGMAGHGRARPTRLPVHAAQMADSSVSPVRMRTTCSTGVTKIFAVADLWSWRP